jgi:hypothetical protein
MKTITLLAIGVIYLLSVCFALSRGYDVKAAFKIPFVVFTFEADGNKKLEPDAKPPSATSNLSESRMTSSAASSKSYPP